MSFEIGEPHRRKPYLLCDLIELLLVINYLGKASITKNDVNAILSGATISADELDQTSHEEDSKTRDEQNMIHELQIEDAWTHLSYRDSAFAEMYPFDVDEEYIAIRDDLSVQQRSYIFLLACSRLRSFDLRLRQRWADLFTQFSKTCFATFLPLHADIRIFDARSTDRSSYYGNRLSEALKKLGQDLATTVDEAECDRRHPSGDEGIDLVGIVSFNDSNRFNIAMLGQCASQETEWTSKIFESHEIALKSVFPRLTAISTTFIPVLYRDSTGDWISNRYTSISLIVDRLRIMTSIRSSGAWDEQIIRDFESDFRNINCQ